MTAERSAASTKLERSITLPSLVLYGLGTAIGAGIYVLIGEASGRAGLLAPVAFILAGLCLAPTAAGYAELAGRLPVSAGEAAYVRAGFNSKTMGQVAGWLVIFAGTFASAAVADGSVGYLREFVDLSPSTLVVLVVMTIGLIAAWGISESVAIAATLTVIEAAGLLAIVGFGLTGSDSVAGRMGDLVPDSLDMDLWSGVFSASLLAVFAFIGFEDMVNVAEETKNPRRTLPRAIFITLAVTTLLYVLVASVAVLSVDPAVLAEDEAPLALVYRETAGFSSDLISTIAVLATLNTILVQIIMVSRVVYGMADRGSMPAIFARVHPRTRTPLLATAITVLVVIVLAVAFPLNRLADFTSQIVLIIWALANLALILMKRRGDPAPEGTFIVPMWVPVAGLVTSLGLLLITSWP